MPADVKSLHGFFKWPNQADHDAQGGPQGGCRAALLPNDVGCGWHPTAGLRGDRRLDPRLCGIASLEMGEPPYPRNARLDKSISVIEYVCTCHGPSCEGQLLNFKLSFSMCERVSVCVCEPRALGARSFVPRIGPSFRADLSALRRRNGSFSSSPLVLHTARATGC